MKRKYLKNSIIVISCILIAVFLQIGVKPLSVSQKGPNTLSVTNIKVSLIVLDKKYEGEVKGGDTVLDAMLQIQSESKIDNPFSFQYREHSGLGVFITEINGQAGGRDGYWIYYINGLEASVGVSNYKIKNGDIVSWKYEK